MKHAGKRHARNSIFILAQPQLLQLNPFPVLLSASKSSSHALSLLILTSADEMGVYDLYMVKRQMFVSAAVISSQLLLVDEIMKAGHGQK